jgi:hypothetical protein
VSNPGPGNYTIDYSKSQNGIGFGSSVRKSLAANDNPGPGNYTSNDVGKSGTPAVSFCNLYHSTQWQVAKRTNLMIRIQGQANTMEMLAQ